MKLFNMNNIHLKQASDIDALTLLHFVADSVRDWECSVQGCVRSDECPFWYDVTRFYDGRESESCQVCLLDAIKDLGFINLEKPLDETDEDE